MTTPAKNQFHQIYPIRSHALVCSEPRGDQPTKDLLSTCNKQRYLGSPNLPDFSRNISLSFHAHESFKTTRTSGDTDVTDERGMYMLQTISIDNNAYTIFFDTGCSDFIVKGWAIQSLGTKATMLSSQVTKIGGVGQTSLQSFGTYNVKIPKHDGGTASFNGISLDSITTTFPQYPLTDVHADIRKSFNSSGGDSSKLPQVPSATFILWLVSVIYDIIPNSYFNFHQAWQSTSLFSTIIMVAVGSLVGLTKASRRFINHSSIKPTTLDSWVINWGCTILEFK